MTPSQSKMRASREREEAETETESCLVFVLFEKEIDEEDFLD